jgi:ion channel-forming bestrophin family protein
MIVRDRPSGWRLFFILRGSIVQQVAKQILLTVLLAVVVTAFRGPLTRYGITFSPVPFTILGLALSIFLGFQNNAAYDRFWEGRKLWGELLISSRILARQVGSILGHSVGEAPDLEAARRRMVLTTIAFAHALRHHLRGSDPRADLEPLIEPDRLEAVLASRNRPEALLRSLGQDLAQGIRAGWIGEPLAAMLDGTLNALGHVAGGCERIKSTPIPFPYTLLLHRTAYLYCFLLPFGLADSVGLATPLISGLVSYTFFGLDALRNEIEEPFGQLPNSLPLAALCRTIEIDLREALGETVLPPPLAPESHRLD